MKLRVLIGMEKSGVFRECFRRLGHDAWSCDLKPSEDGSKFHIVGDVRNYLTDYWHVGIFHPVCRRMTNAGSRWLHVPPPGKTLLEMWTELDEGCALFSDCLNSRIQCVAIENPIMHGHAKERIRNYRKYDQTVHPYQFGAHESSIDNERKRTMWWLKNLSDIPTLDILDGTTARATVHETGPYGHGNSDRETERSRTFPGMAAAATDQWVKDAIAHHKWGLPIR